MNIYQAKVYHPTQNFQKKLQQKAQQAWYLAAKCPRALI